MTMFLKVNKSDNIDSSLLQWVVDALRMAVEELNKLELKNATIATAYIHKAIDDVDYMILKGICTQCCNSNPANLNEQPQDF